MLKTEIFVVFYHKNRHKCAIFHNIKNPENQIVSLHGRMLWYKFQQNRTIIETPDTFCVTYSKFLDFSYRFIRDPTKAANFKM